MRILTTPLFFLLLFVLSIPGSYAQQISITGKVTDAKSGDPVPFANVVFKGTTIGATTDFDGRYEISTNNPGDSLVASYIGYKARVKYVVINQSVILNFQLEEDIIRLREVIFLADENPAFAIMRNAVANKDKHDKRNLKAYEFESYSKIEFDLDNLTEKFKSRKMVQKVKAVIDSIDQIAGDDGQPILPLFISESISRSYFRNHPKLNKEHILKTKIIGVGVQDGTFIGNFIGSSFQEYNFYQNWLNIWTKEFVSPISDGWKGYYDVYLTDSLYIGDHYCYRIDLYPKRKGDLAFNGSIWLTTDTYALKQVDVWIDKTANLNYIEKLKIQQELEPSGAGPWIPVKSRIFTDFSGMSDFGFGKSTGFLAKFYTSNKNWIINQPHEPKFYNQTIELAEDATIMDDEFWEQNRHDPLSTTEANVVKMIDTLKSIRPVKRMTDLITYAATGYITIGKLDLGPYPLFYAVNNIEENRFRLGGRTNIHFSNKWVFKGYGAYGTLDKKWKYGVGVDRIISRKPWTELRLLRKKDIQQIGLTFDDVFSNVNLFAFETYFRNIDHNQPYFLTENSISLRRELAKGLNQKIIFTHKQYEPINVDSSFNYAYRVMPGLGDVPNNLINNFNTSEIILETRYGKDELWVQYDNDRVSMGPLKAPVITIRYTFGINGLLNSDFTYHKVTLNILKSLKMGFTGVSYFSLTTGKIFGDVPLPLLKGHIGNEAPFYIPIAYNTMGFSEFVSDSYASLNYYHKFEGFLLNRIPLFKKLKWRAVGTANILFGDVSSDNKQIHALTGVNGLPNEPIKALGKDPYIELGYGIENIFKILRLDLFHRLTYLDNREGDKIAFRFSLQFIL